ncbi:MAG TPA: hypothetical protein VK447_00645, partial [Myxococcaceae bacterium]|nr:hypothetical protein [Myxococcaceae bacterium]
MATEVPYGRILAEAEAWPLSSRYAYGCRVFRLGRASVGMLDADTERLAEGLSEHLRAKAGGASLAGLAAIRDKAWFGADTEDAQDAVDIPLAKYVIRLANAHLERAGTGTVLRADRLASGEDAAARAGHWRWLSLRIPADLLIAAAYATDGEQPPSDHVSLATSHLARILREHPVADTHLHAAAGVGFPVLWTSLMLWLTHEAPSPALLD